MHPEIIVVGSFVVGVTVRLPRMPYPGESLVGDLLDVGPGGKGTNLAVAAARQGAHVGLIAKVGDDMFANMAYELYAREGIEHSLVTRTAAEPTAMGLVYLQQSGENTIGVYRGANWLLRPEDVAAARSMAGGARVLTVQLEVPDETVAAALELGRQCSLATLLNPAPARPLDNRLIGMANILTPNAGEARILVGLRPDDDSIGLADIGQQLLERGPGVVIITMGAQGCLVLQHATEPAHIPAYPVQPVDTVGAGDAFNGGLAVALARGYPLLEAARWANATAALSTTRIGAISALPDYQQVAEFVRSGT